MVAPINGFGGLFGKSASQKAGLSREQFMKLLSAEISNQDPLAPMDNTQFLQQLVAMEDLRASAAMTDGMGSFMNFFQLSIASGTIGKLVTGLSDSGAPIQGLVMKVKASDGNVVLSTTAGDISFRNVSEIKLPVVGG